jgi:adenine-specific DNA-methyltransferase
MTNQDLKQSIEAALKRCATKSLAEAAIELLDILGYRSEKRLALKPNTSNNFLSTFAKNRTFNTERALLSEWRSVDFLFQLTDEEVQAVALGDQSSLFESTDKYEGAIVESYLFFALELEPRRYTRTELSAITRAVNGLFSMPAFLFLRHGDTATLAVIRRRLHKRDESKDVLEKVTLIKDIVLADPIRAHIEILHDLALPVLFDEYRFHNFVGLHQAWEKRLGSYALNERFYREVAAWYFWAMGHKHVTLPRSIENLRDKDERDKQRSIFFIRLLTRLIFCWFLQEKRLIPRDLFRMRIADSLLKDSSPKAGTYYRAFLQNLFFGTLNQEQEKRDWRKEYEKSTRKGNRGATNLWRYRDLLEDPDQIESLLRDQIPFVNGGLFDCLDQVFQEKENREDVRLDDFSEEKANGLCLPNELFFGGEREVDLSSIYDDQRRKKEKVRGLIETLSRYKFTVEENTPLEEEIALDPELLGKVFENLLASYNEDTRTTARKALGGFYTPREIVNYMVDEALIAFFKTAIPGYQIAQESDTQKLEARLRDLFTAHPTTFANPFTPTETAALIAAIGGVKIIDPACGSGAFPMGALHRLVDLLQKLDPKNESWKRDRLAEAERYCDILRQSDAPSEEINLCEDRIEDIRKSFDAYHHALDFARKLYIIENSIYGIDIQPIATQIAKLRFFISLIVDQQVDASAPNLGVRPLPNLETKIVAADALVPLEKPHHQMDLVDAEIRPLRRELEQVRHDHFNARTPSAKFRCRQRDAELRSNIAELLRQNGLPAGAAKALSGWDPYDQNHFAPFFDPEWMFGLPVGKMRTESHTNESGEIESGFDIAIGNPPYVRMEQIKQFKPLFSKIYDCFSGRADLYVYFYERSIKLLRNGGLLAFISSDTFFNRDFGEKLREFLSKNTSIEILIDFGETGVFKAFTEPCVVLVRRGPFPNPRVRVFKWDEREEVEDVRAKIERGVFTLPQKHFHGQPWRIEVPKINRLLEQFARSGLTVGDIAGHRILRGVVTGLNDAFVINDATRRSLIRENRGAQKIIKPFLRGRDIGRWTIAPTSAWLIYIPKGTDISGYPSVERHLRPFKAELEKRATKQAWYELQQAQFAYVEEFCGPKIVFQDIARSYGMAWDAEGHFLANTCYFIPGPFKWLLGVLMSAPMRFFVHKRLGAEEGGFIRLFSGQVERFPVPASNDSQRQIVERLVDCIVWLNRIFQTQQEKQEARDSLMLSWWEQVLNGLAYELYFADDLHARGLHLFGLLIADALPDLNSLPEADRLPTLRLEFERTYATDHPLRGALSGLRSLEIVRTIEGDK